MFPGQPADLRTPDIRSRYSSEREDVISVRSRRATVVECGPRLGMSGHVWASLADERRLRQINAMMCGYEIRRRENTTTRPTRRTASAWFSVRIRIVYGTCSNLFRDRPRDVFDLQVRRVHDSIFLVSVNIITFVSLGSLLRSNSQKWFVAKGGKLRISESAVNETGYIFFGQELPRTS